MLYKNVPRPVGRGFFLLVSRKITIFASRYILMERETLTVGHRTHLMWPDASAYTVPSRVYA